jgi:hypothetical protein
MKLRPIRFLVIPFFVSLLLASIVVFFLSGHVRDYLPPELARPEYAKVDQTKPVDAQTRLIEIGGRTFKIPLKYIEVLDDRGTHQRGVLLKVIWPDMKSLFDLKDRQEYDQLWAEHRFGNINLSAASSHPPISQMMENRRHWAKKFPFVQVVNGLEEYTLYQPDGVTPFKAVYLEKDSSGIVISFIDCSQFPLKGFTKYYPVCEQQFVEGGLLYVISYNQEDYFVDWPKQRQRTIDFVNSFELKPRASASGGKP